MRLPRKRCPCRLRSLRIIKFQQYNCEGGSVRKRQIRTAFIKSITDTVDKFVISERRSTAADGERGCSAKIGEAEQNLAHFRILRSYTRGLA